ncbi:MAG: lipase family protein [Burkholderiales bacterium]|nr:lipase family protein [Burkholderiales bacterium]
MRKKHFSSIFTVILVLFVSSCSNGGSSPTDGVNYGQLVSVSQQQLNNATSSGVLSTNQYSYANPYMLGVLQQISGSYLHYESDSTAFLNAVTDIDKRLNNEIANIDNTKSLYNYNPVLSTSSSMIESVSVFAMKYKTPGQDAETMSDQIERTASGLVIIPNMSNGAKIRGVVLYFHGTVFAKNQVPSCLGIPKSGMNPISANQPDYCNLPGNHLGVNEMDVYGALSVFAESGFAVIAPDYVGMGSDYDNVHPYAIFPQVNAKSGLYMLEGLNQILESYGYQTESTLPLFITGYSEGGAYAVSASYLAQNELSNFVNKNKIQIAVTSPLEGAYSLQDQMQYEFDPLYDGMFSCPSQTESNFICGESSVMISDGESINPIVYNLNNWKVGSSTLAALAKPLLLAYTQSSVVYYLFNNLTTAYNFIFTPQFWSGIPVYMNHHLVFANLYQLFGGIYGPYISDDMLQASIILNTEARSIPFNTLKDYPVMLYDGNIAAFSVESHLIAPLGDNNQASIFMHTGIQTNPIFVDVVNAAATYNWQTNYPINFIHLAYDSVVTVMNSYQAVSCMTTGKSFIANESYQVSSYGVCSTRPSTAGLISETIIPNFQINNNSVQMKPLNLDKTINSAAISKFWQAPQYSDLANLPESVVPSALIDFLELNDYSVPFDHLSIPTLGNIIALCTFENYLKSGVSGASNSVCQ